MRWWLALAFAGIAALTAIAVAQVFSARSEAAIRERARELAAGAAVTAALELSTAESQKELDSTVSEFARSRALSLFVFNDDGALLTPNRSRGISFTSLPNRAELRAKALDGRRVVETIDDGRLVTVALPLRGERPGALIAVAARPELEDAIGIVQEEIVRAALWAVGIAAVVGIGVALLITRRIRRIGSAAAEIEQGRFDRELRPRFHDELGALAQTIDSMRQRLRGSFIEIEGERDRLNRLLEQLQEGVVAVDESLNVEFANSRARELLSSDLEPGEQLPDLWSSFSLREAVSPIFNPGATARTIRAHPDRARTYVISVLPPTAASPAGVVVLTDVSEQERRERAEREFVTNAAHELRTPLAAIASAVEVLQQGAKEEPADRDRFLDVVERQTTRLTSLARALLTLARAQTRSEPVRLEPVAVVPLLREIAGDVENGSVTFAAGEDVEVLAHPELLRQALENLASNAVKHGAGGSVVLEVAAEDDTHLRIAVKDEGSGMAADDAERALDRFYRASGSDVDGFGLGLSIVREAAAAMGGRISIDSEPDEGTTVSIVLRAATKTTS
jgi:signal transduction histidine kinase